MKGERFRAEQTPAFLWGVRDDLARCWAITPKLGFTQSAMVAAAEKLNGAQRGGGHS